MLGPMDKFLTRRAKQQNPQPAQAAQSQKPTLQQRKIPEFSNPQPPLLRENLRIYHTPKPPNVMRILSQNIRGLNPSTPTKLHSIAQTTKRLQIDVLCLQELNDSLPQIRRAQISKALSLEGQRVALTTSTLTPHVNDTSYQPGGALIATVTQMHRKGRNTSDPWKMGRWAMTSLKFAPTAYVKTGRIHILSIYRATAQNSGINSSLMQQRRKLLNENRPPNPLATFSQDLHTQLTSLHEKGDALILLGDFNCSLQAPIIKSITEKFALTDIMSQIHGHTPPTREGGSLTIDHILLSTPIAAAIQKAEFLPFKFGINSDHRALIIDIDLNMISGRSNITTTKPQRALDSRKIISAKMYKDIMTEFLKNTETIKLLDSIPDPMNSRTKRTAIRRLELLDRKQTRAMIEAEKALPKQTGNEWSPELDESVRLHHYWTTIAGTTSAGKRLHQDTRRELEATVEHIDKYQGNPSRSVWSQKRFATKRLKQAKKFDQLNRKKFLRSLLETRSAAEKTTVQAILQAESKIHLHQRFKTILRPRRGQIREVKTIDEGQTILYSTRTEVEQALHLHNERHFAQPQARQAPFASGPLYSHFGHGSTTKEALNFISDPHHKLPSTIHPLAREVMQELRPTPFETESASYLLDTGTLIEAYSAWKERTSTSPHGTHLGHYKVWLKDYESESNTNENSDSIKTHLTPSQFFSIQAKKLNLAIKLKHPLRRWRRVHMLFIPKDDDDIPKIDRLRPIDSFDSEINLLRRVLVSHRTMALAEENRSITDLQWGGRRGRQCSDLTLQNQLHATIHTLTRHDGAISELDATSCFDNIATNLMYLAYCKNGLHSTPMQLLSKALMRHQYFPITEHGVSARRNGHSNTTPFFGPGQGSSDGTNAWGMIHDKLAKVYERMTECGQFTGVRGDITWKAIMGAFVDDVSLHHKRGPTENVKDLQDIASRDIQLWTNLLWTSGGAINFKKTKSYSKVIKWAFNSNGVPFLMPQQEYKPTVKEPPTGLLRNITQVSPYTATRALGVWRSLDLSNDLHLDKLRLKRDEFHRALTRFPATPYEALHLYKTVYHPQISFSLPTTSLGPAEVKSLQSNLIGTLMLKMKLPRTYPRALVFAPHSRMGLGIPDLEFVQGLQKVEKVISHLRMGSTLGDLIQIVLEWYQLSSGIQQSILDDTSPITYVYCPWVTTLRSFLYSTGATMHIPQLWTPTPQRENDSCLMDLFRQMPFLPLATINAVRLHLRVTYLSDITTHDGRLVIDHRRQNPRLVMGRESKLQWPVQPSPSANMWRAWDEAISTITNKSGRLPTRLGAWRTRLESHWDFWRSQSDPNTLLRKGTVPTRHTRIGGSYRKIFHPRGEEATIPEDSTPVPASQDAQGIYVRGELQSEEPQEDVAQDKVSTDWTTYFVEQATPNKHPRELAIHLQDPESTVHMVTDGGASGTSGYYGWVIASPMEILYSGSGRLACHSSQLQSLRPETTAMLACTTFFIHFLNTHPIRVRSPVAHWVDNMTLVWRLQRHARGEHSSQKLMLLPDMDLQLQLEDNLEKLSNQHYVTPVTRHVRGHQDTKKKGDLLWQETLNVAADDAASSSECAPKPALHFLPKQIVALHVHGTQVTTGHRKTLEERWAESGTHSITDYLSRKYNWSADTVRKIDWKAVPRQKMGIRKRSFTVSYSHRWLPLNLNLHKRTSIGTPLCPMCDMEEEDHEHFMKCPCYKGLTLQAILGKVDNCAKAQQVNPVLCLLVQRGLQISFKGTQHINSTDIPRGYQALISEQEQIGWSHLWFSRWSSRWGDYQSDYEKVQGTQQTNGVKWIRRLTSLIWEHMYEKWKLRGKTIRGIEGPTGWNGLQERVDRLYELKGHLPTRYHFLFSMDRHQVQTQDKSKVLHWLRTSEPTILRAVSRLRKKTRKVTELERWMGRRLRKRRRRRGSREQIKRWEMRMRNRRRTTR